jgi:NarL family two-component system sensor histidine kinase LiaS
MRRLKTLFSRLHWKLTLTYTLVTVAALLVVELGLLGLSQFMEPVLLPPAPARYAIEYVAPQARPFLETQPVDTEGLNNWLLKTAIQGYPISTADDQKTWLGLVIAFQGDRQMMIFDCQGQVLASLPAESLHGQKPYSNKNDIPGMSRLWSIALSGETDPEHLYEYCDDDFLTTVAPILDREGGCLGVIAITGTSARNEIPDAPTFLSIVGASALGFTLAAAIIGLIFGFVAARNLSRRIDKLAQAADSWSKGDFKAFVHDRSNDELGQLAQHLNQMAEQLQNLLHSRQQVAILEERNRLARDLHDSVKQKAFGLAAQLGTIRATLPENIDAVWKYLKEAEQLTSQIRSELTGLIHELRPMDVNGGNLDSRLGSYLEEWSRRHGITVECQINADNSLPASIDKAYWMVIQEALSNAAQHSKATRIDVYFMQSGWTVELVIKDNGRGFNLEEVVGRGLGLLSMRERMEALGGQLNIESAPNEGTRITASCRLQDTPPANRDEKDMEDGNEGKD